MKKTAFAFSLLTALTLSAQEDENNSLTETCCTPEPSASCCECYGYLPAYYDLECDWGLFVTVDFLYWFAKESNLAYTTKVKNISSGAGAVISPTTFKYMDAEWDPGVRVGLGWNTCHDGWDLFLNWTYTKNTSKDSTSVPNFGQASTFYLPETGQSALLNPWINASYHFDDDLINTVRLFDKVTGHWQLTFNQIDLELGRKSWASRCFTLRPYAALRGAWVKSSFETDSSRTTFDPNTNQNVSILFKDQFHSKYWGVGFLAGLQPNWHFCESIILFSNFDAALIWGDFNGKKQEKYLDQRTDGATTTRINTSSESTSSMNTMLAILDLSLGLRWEKTWCCNRYRTALDLGWEQHYWFDFDHRFQTFGHYSNDTGSIQGFTSFGEVASDLMFGGLILRFRIDF